MENESFTKDKKLNTLTIFSKITSKRDLFVDVTVELV